tara:strand:+ start:299 stop:865 length:567 start_codon:yes stop_codon:yes gene_type:complete
MAMSRSATAVKDQRVITDRPNTIFAPTEHRWKHHRHLAETLTQPGEARDFLYRITGPEEARVRYRDQDLSVPAQGTPINWRIDFSPKLRGQYGNGVKYRRKYDDALVARQLGGALYPAIIVTGIEIVRRFVPIEREGSKPFPLAEARVWGNGLVEDRDELERLMRQGIGEAKAWGCGMLEIDIHEDPG